MVRGLIVLLCGIATTLLTAAALVYLEVRYDCAFYSFVYGFVIPFGAMISGFVAASGYYLGSRLMSYRPGRGMLAAVLAVSGANFFFIYYLEYRLLKVDGESVTGWLTFPDYLKFVLTHTSISIGASQSPSDTYTLGIGGYLFAALLILGFACGGFLIYRMVRIAPYCEACGLFMKKHGSQTRYFVRYEDLAASAAAFQAEMGQGQFRHAMAAHGAAGAREADEKTGYSLCVEVRQCKGCGKQWISLIGKQRQNKRWNVLPKIRYTAYCTERVDALEQLA